MIDPKYLLPLPPLDGGDTMTALELLLDYYPVKKVRVAPFVWGIICQTTEAISESDQETLGLVPWED